MLQNVQVRPEIDFEKTRKSWVMTFSRMSQIVENSSLASQGQPDDEAWEIKLYKWQKLLRSLKATFMSGKQLI